MTQIRCRSTRLQTSVSTLEHPSTWWHPLQLMQFQLRRPILRLQTVYGKKQFSIEKGRESELGIISYQKTPSTSLMWSSTLHETHWPRISCDLKKLWSWSHSGFDSSRLTRERNPNFYLKFRLKSSFPFQRFRTKSEVRQTLGMRNRDAQSDDPRPLQRNVPSTIAAEIMSPLHCHVSLAIEFMTNPMPRQSHSVPLHTNRVLTTTGDPAARLKLQPFKWNQGVPAEGDRSGRPCRVALLHWLMTSQTTAF